MSLDHFFEEVTNPLDNPRFIDNIVDAYLETKKFRNFYSCIVKHGANQKKYPNRFMIKDRDEFYSLIFNEWKHRITSMTKEEFIELRNKNKLDDSFVTLRNYLLKVPDQTTYEGVDKILHSRYDDKTLDFAMDRYRFTAFGEGSSWDHISSNAVTTEKDPYFPIYHRLYLDTEGIETYKLVTEITKKCLQRHIPYYFKFTEFADRQDNVVIYASTELLPQYIEILREIKKEQKDTIHPLEPPMMSGVIDGWIGYGSEPERKPNGELQSFNEKRADLLEMAIKETTFKWLDKNARTTMKKNGREKPVKEFFIDKCTYFLLQELQTRYENLKKYNDDNYIINYLGYSLNDLRNQQVIDSIKNTIRSNWNEIRNTKKINIEMTVRNGKTISFNNYHLQEAIKRLIEVIRPGRGYEFNEMLKQEILTLSPQNNISLNNFSIDVSAVRRINKEIVNNQRRREIERENARRREEAIRMQQENERRRRELEEQRRKQEERNRQAFQAEMERRREEAIRMQQENERRRRELEEQRRKQEEPTRSQSDTRPTSRYASRFGKSRDEILQGFRTAQDLDDMFTDTPEQQNTNNKNK